MSPEKEKQQSRSRRAVIMYTIALFAVVIVFILLSYFIDKRNDTAVAALHEQNSSALQKIEALGDEAERLRGETAEKDALIAELEEELRQARLDWAEDTKRIEDRYKADYNELLQELNELLSQTEEEE